MVRRMRARLQRFLPIVLVALAMQVLAPIAASWASLAVADPLQDAAICHNAGPGTGPDDQSGAPAAHAGSCSICCLAQAAASFEAPQAGFAIPIRHAERVAWREMAAPVIVCRDGSSAQARAPPRLT